MNQKQKIRNGGRALDKPVIPSYSLMPPTPTVFKRSVCNMEYSNLLKYCIEWGKSDFYLETIFSETRFNKDMKDKMIPNEFKEEMKKARGEYLEYIGGEKMNMNHCFGCYENFYNSENKKCWSFDKNKVTVTKYFIDKETPMNIKSAYRKMTVPPCYKKQDGVLLNEIPNYAK